MNDLIVASTHGFNKTSDIRTYFIHSNHDHKDHTLNFKYRYYSTTNATVPVNANFIHSQDLKFGEAGFTDIKRSERDLFNLAILLNEATINSVMKKTQDDTLFIFCKGQHQLFTFNLYEE